MRSNTLHDLDPEGPAEWWQKIDIPIDERDQEKGTSVETVNDVSRDFDKH